VNADLEKAHPISLPVEISDVSIDKKWNIRIYRNTEDRVAYEDIYMGNGKEKSITIQPCEALMIDSTRPNP
jgi:hypothetical protein